MIRATTGPKKPVSRLTKTERWARTDQVFSSLGLIGVVVDMPGPAPPPDPLGSGSTPLFLRSSDMAHLPISPYLCTDKYARLIRMFHGHSVILPTCAAKTRDPAGGGDREPQGRLRGKGGQAYWVLMVSERCNVTDRSVPDIG